MFSNRPSIVVLVLCLITTIAGCNKSIDDERIGGIAGDHNPGDHPPIEEVVQAPVTVDELSSALSRDYPPDIEYALNEVKQSRLDYEVTKLVACAYTKCDARNSSWHPVIFENDLVRVNLLDVLVQAKIEGIDFSNGRDFREPAIQFLVNENPFVVQRALMILAHIDDPGDVPSIEDVAMRTPNDITYRVAILALKLMSSDRAEEAIHRILDSSDEHRRSLVRDLIE